MRNFDYRAEAMRLLTNKTLDQIEVMGKFLGEKCIIDSNNPGVLEHMTRASHLHTVAAGTRLIGFKVPISRIKNLVFHDGKPENREELMIVRYAGINTAIYDDTYKAMGLCDIMQKMHEDLYAGLADTAGPWRTADEPVYWEANDRHFKLQPIASQEIPEMIHRICEQYDSIKKAGDINLLFLIPLIVLDLVCIQPFAQGNYVIIRLLILHMLRDAGYPIAKYVSIEKTTENPYEMYVAFEHSVYEWELGINDYQPVFAYIMDLLSCACDLFEHWVKFLSHSYVQKQDMVYKVIELHGGVINKQMIEELVPNIPETTIQNTLRKLLHENKIEKIGDRRYSAYRYIKPE